MKYEAEQKICCLERCV